MFRSIVIAVTLTGMSLCQYRCMGEGASACDEQQGKHVVASGCPCCRPPQSSTPDERRESPCCPQHDGDCHCQGVCGGALTGEAPALDGLLQSWAAVAVLIAAPDDQAAAASRLSPTDGPPPAPKAADGRALRLLISSLLT